MGRSPCCDKNNNGLKKGPWTPEEDQLLIDYIQTHGPGNWRNLPKNAGLQRCGKSCRLRWTNYLRPDIKRGRFSFEEEETIIQLHSVMGNKWSAIAARLPGRTDNEIKNYWNTHIRKRLLRMGIDPVTHTPRLDLLDMSSILRSALGNPSNFNLNLQGLLVNPDLLKLAATATLVSQNLQHSTINNINNYINNAANYHHQVPPLPHFQTLPNQNYNNVNNNGLLLSGNCSSFQENSNPCFVGEELISQQYSELVRCLNDNGNQNMYESTPLSTATPTPLNSSSTTLVNSSTEEERDTYCSDLFKFEIPESLDINEFL